MGGALVVAILAPGCGSRSGLEADDASASIDGARIDAADAGADVAIDVDDATIPDGSVASDASMTIDAEGVAPCLTGGNVFHVEGDPDDTVYPATATVGPNDGTWSAVESGGLYVQVAVSAPGTSSLTWGFAFSTITTSMPIAVGTYDPVVGPSNTTTYPTLRLVTDGRFCNDPRMRVTIAEFQTTGPMDEGDLVALTATFEQHCNGATAAIRGCLHFNR